MKLQLHHRLGWRALALAVATTIAVPAQVPPDEGAGSRLTLIPHAWAAPPPEPPAPRTIKVLSYNAYGAVRGPRTVRRCTTPNPFPHGPQRPVCRLEKQWGKPFDGVDHHPFRFVDVLADRIAAERPQLVGLQEMCGSQVNHLERALASRGYPMAAHVAYNPEKPADPRCPTNEGRWPPRAVGKAVLAQGAATLVGQDSCVEWQGQIPIRFCSVHTEPKDGKLQSVARTLNGWAQTGAVIAAGDFNAQPHEPIMDTMYKGDDEDPRGRGRFYEADTSIARAFGFYYRYGGRTNRGLLPEKIDYVFADAGHFEKERARAWVEDTEGQCGSEACSDHRMLWAEVFLRDRGLAALAGLWLGVGGEVAHDFSVLRIRPDGSINERDLWDSGPFSSGQLVVRGGGTYSATLHFPSPGVDPSQLRIEVVDCGAPRRRFPFCLSDTGPIELYVEGDYGYTNMFNRLMCGGGVDRPPDLPPLSGPYASPCEYNTGRP